MMERANWVNISWKLKTNRLIEVGRFFVGHDAKSKAMSLIWACLEMMINQWAWESNQYQTNPLGLDLFRELSFSALIF